MKKNVLVLICILCAVNVFARIPSVQEAQQHLNLNECSATWEAERLQSEAGRKHINNYYYVKITKVPQSAISIYDKKEADNNTAFRAHYNYDDYLNYMKDYVEADFDFSKYNEKCPPANTEYSLKRIAEKLAEMYVRTHVNIYTNELIYYIYPFEITLYVRRGSTGQTCVYDTYTENVIYSLYSGKWDKVINLTLQDGLGERSTQRSASMSKTVNYIVQTYTAQEIMSILGLIEPIRAAIRQHAYHISYNDAWKRMIGEINEKIMSAGPILPHNPAIEDKYNKAMFGDMSAQIQRLPSSSINQARYPDGGDSGINSYVARNIKYPAALQKDGIDESAVYILTIDKNGQVKDVVADNYKLNSDLRNQTISLLKKLPKRFTPASGFGQNIESTYRVRIDYELEPVLKFEKQTISLPYSQKEERIKVTARKEWSYTQPQNSSIKARRDGNYLVVSCQKRRESDYNAINDKIIVSTADNSASYTINISQAGAPRPFIRVEKNKVVIPRDGTAQTINVSSNRKWSVVNPNADTRFNLITSSSTLTIGARKNLSKKGHSVSYSLKTADGEASASVEVYQNGRADESYGTSGYGRIYENYYERNGRYGLTFANLHLGVGAPVPTFDEVYIPVNLEAFAIRIYMVELSLASFRADFSIDGFDGLAWEPQLKFLLPINEKVAILPYAGPTCQMDIDDIHNSTWSFSAGTIVRYSWGRKAFSDFSIDYHGGPFGGLSVGLSIGFGSGYSN